MCEGGVATWNRSSGPSPSASHQCAVAWPIERCVWRTALGSPVVPELNTSTASSVVGDVTRPARASARRPRAASSAGRSSRSVTRVGAEALARGARRPSPSATACDGCGQRDGVADLDAPSTPG